MLPSSISASPISATILPGARPFAQPLRLNVVLHQRGEERLRDAEADGAGGEIHVVGVLGAGGIGLRALPGAEILQLLPRLPAEDVLQRVVGRRGVRLHRHPVLRPQHRAVERGEDGGRARPRRPGVRPPSAHHRPAEWLAWWMIQVESHSALRSSAARKGSLGSAPASAWGGGRLGDSGLGAADFGRRAWRFSGRRTLALPAAPPPRSATPGREARHAASLPASVRKATKRRDCLSYSAAALRTGSFQPGRAKWQV